MASARRIEYAHEEIPDGVLRIVQKSRDRRDRRAEQTVAERQRSVARRHGEGPGTVGLLWLLIG